MRKHHEQAAREHTEHYLEEPDATQYHPPAPVPTAFGASTVGDAVAASAMASGRPEDERDPREEDTARPGDGAVYRSAPHVGAEASPTGDDTERVDPATLPVDHPDVEALPTRRLDPNVQAPDRDTTAAVREGAEGYGQATPTMVDPDAAATTLHGHRHAAMAGDSVRMAGMTAAPGTPATVSPADSGESLFGAELSRQLQERWRDVQLRFVDDPRAATEEARLLVTEAVEQLTRSLGAPDDRAGTGTDDTERMRLTIRGYRDLFDRLLGR